MAEIDQFKAKEIVNKKFHNKTTRKWNAHYFFGLKKCNRSTFCCQSELWAPVNHRDRVRCPNWEKRGERSTRNETGLSSSTTFQIQKRSQKGGNIWVLEASVRQLAKPVSGTRKQSTQESWAQGRAKGRRKIKTAGSGHPTGTANLLHNAAYTLPSGEEPVLGHRGRTRGDASGAAS